jgi:hypothetical protein
MPKMGLSSIHAIFTEHLIRIVKAGEAYPY